MRSWFAGGAAGEPLRVLATDYELAHTTLSRYFARPEVAKRLREVRRCVLAERRAARQALPRRKERSGSKRMCG
jgi:hypothetical protein